MSTIVESDGDGRDMSAGTALSSESSVKSSGLSIPSSPRSRRSSVKEASGEAESMEVFMSVVDGAQ